MNWQYFGIAAAAITTAGFIPQIIKGYKTKHLKDLSYEMNFLLTIGFGMWLIYGIARKDMVIVAANIAGVILNLVLITMKWHYSRHAMKKV
jgi:MtN3 and saliva related transmembrane protein